MYKTLPMFVNPYSLFLATNYRELHNFVCFFGLCSVLRVLQGVGTEKQGSSGNNLTLNVMTNPVQFPAK